MIKAQEQEMPCVTLAMIKWQQLALSALYFTGVNVDETLLSLQIGITRLVAVFELLHY